MADASDYMRKFKSIFGMPEDDDSMSFSLDVETPEKAKTALEKIIIMQKELRLLKKEINAEIKIIRARYSEEISKVGTDFWSTFARNRSSIKLNSMKKTSMKNEQASELEPYNELIRIIDKNMIVLDKAKLDIKEELGKETK